MKYIWKEVILSAVLGLAVPSLCLSLAVGIGGGQLAPVIPETSIPETAASAQSTTPSQESMRSSVPITVILDGQAREMDLEEYISCVVLAEMPAQFEPEALKAQAVVARTYALRRMETGNKHENGDVCGEPGCCQGYKSPEDYLTQGGKQEDADKISAAVRETAGQVLTYEGALIEATYFSCSGGTTEDALAVWGMEIPYLQSTESPGEENATHYTDTVFLTRAEFIESMDTPLSGSPTTWLGQVTYTAGGGVDTIRIGGKIYRGTEVRSLLGLRSTDFTMTATEEGIEVVTHGYGHRVGMSQYGADAMAVNGSDYTQILAHYYQGTELTQYEP